MGNHVVVLEILATAVKRAGVCSFTTFCDMCFAAVISFMTTELNPDEEKSPVRITD